MRSFILKSFIFSISIFTLLSISGCLKGEFDTPPSNLVTITDEQIISFDKLFEKLETGKVNNIGEEKYLEALVVADDKSGNFFKNLILHDLKSEKGISVSLDENELHALYPVGQVVYVSLKDLSIGYFEGLPTLGINSGNTVGRVPATLVRSVMIKAGRTMEVVPRKVNLADLGTKHFNTLIELEGMQFEAIGSNVKYADNTGTSPLSINHNLQNCSGGKIVLRNSGFADFAGETVPTGNGKIVVVYSYYRNAAQLFIRDVSDLDFSGERCSGTGGGGISGNRVSIESVRAQYTGTATTLTKDFIQGIVISDIVNKNINGQNVVVQDGEFGILCRFKSAINLPLGTEVKVGLAGGSLSEFNNLLQVQNLENTNVEPISSGKSITPKVLTVSQIDLSKHESTLIKIENATLIGGTKYSDSGVKVKDATGEIALFTLTAATFSGQSLPSGTVTVTAIVSDFTSGKQLTIRSANDVTGGTPCDVNVATADCDGDGVPNGQDCAPLNAAIYPGAPCDDGDDNTVNDQYDSACVCKGSAAGAGFEETFSSQTNNADINLQGWVNVAVKGTRKWQAKLFSGNLYAQATSFNDSAPEMESWLITPVINTASASTLSFESAKAFWVHDGLTVWVASNFTGNPSTTTWTKIDAKVAKTTDPDNTFIPSGSIDLKGYGASVRVGFKYEGNSATNTSTYRVDNVRVR